jgi:deoxyxylulose-5-phosphate synthase
MHSTGIIDPQTGLATSVAAPGWTSVFSDELIKRAAKRRDVVAITAAMPGPTGLSAFRKRFPDRFFDVGIAEQHAMTSAAGLAMGGMHPVVAIYSTFLNRAFDHHGARPCRRHRPRRRQPQRHVGHVHPRHRPGDAGGRPARCHPAA